MESARPRLNSIDLVRGIAMVLMALDHVRDFFFVEVGHDGTNLNKTWPTLFLTRWVTHFCAPVFVMLAGTGAALAIQRGKTMGEQSWFMLTRGLWLVLLELIVVHAAGWFFNFDFTFLQAWVIWALGWTMVGMAALLWLPQRLVLILGLIIIFGHNLLDDIDSARLGPLEELWLILHGDPPVSLMFFGSVELAIGYPLLPWLGVMMVGYGLGEVYTWKEPTRQRVLFYSGLTCLLLFAAIRASNLYGDPMPWIHYGDYRVLLSELNCTKYPPSLCYLLMTLGPALVLLALTEHTDGPIARFFITFGRVPLFFYLLHLPLIHALACLACYVQLGHVGPFLYVNPSNPASDDHMGYGFGLPVVYGVWFLVIAMLYPACIWYAGFKARHRWMILSYL